MNRQNTHLFNDNSILTWGKYRGVPFSEIPGAYFLFLLQGGIADLGLKEYVELNKNQFEQEPATCELRISTREAEMRIDRRDNFRRRMGYAKPLQTRPGDNI